MTTCKLFFYFYKLLSVELYGCGSEVLPQKSVATAKAYLNKQQN